MDYKNLLANMSVCLFLLCNCGTGFAQEKNKASEFPDIVYTSQQDKFEDGSGIYLLTNGKSKLLTPGFLFATNACWSPDGTKIAFCGRKKESDPYMIFVLDVAKNQFMKLTSKKWGSGNPSWSPDGKTIAFNARRIGEELEINLFLVNSDGSNMRRISDKLSGVSTPSWSKDGSRISFVRTSDASTQSNIYTVTINGKGERKITTVKGLCISPAWSPDGKRIAFASNRHTDSDNLSNLQIFVMNSDGTDVRKITNLKHQNNTPDWSPDGKRILFYSIKHINTKELLHHPPELYIINADGTGLKKLTGTKKNAYFPRWRPQPKK